MNNRWSFIPRSRGVSALYLIAGLLLAISTGYQIANDGAAVLPVLALVAALAVVAVAVVGLVAPRTHSR